MTKMRLACTLLALPALLLTACGGGGSKTCSATHLTNFLPASAEVTGWSEDTGPTAGESGPQATCLMNDPDLPDATEWVNGAMDFFDDVGGWKGLAKEYYINADEVKIALYIHEMDSATSAQAVYAAIVDYSGMTWTDATLGGGESMARIGSAGPVAPMYIEAIKGKYFVETQTKPSATDEQVARDFFIAVLNKLP